GKVWTAKASTTPDEFSRGVMDAIAEAARAGGMESAQLLEQTILFKHGSTIATNALINRSGVKVGFITTKGFEDTTEIMRAIGRVDGLSPDEIKQVTWLKKPTRNENSTGPSAVRSHKSPANMLAPIPPS